MKYRKQIEVKIKIIRNKFNDNPWAGLEAFQDLRFNGDIRTEAGQDKVHQILDWLSISFSTEERLRFRVGPGNPADTDAFGGDGSLFYGDPWKGRNEWGAYQWPCGTSYIGQFYRGVISGAGVMSKPDGEAHIGMWRDGRYNGLGCHRFLDGTVYCGWWLRDQMMDERGATVYYPGNDPESSLHPYIAYHGTVINDQLTGQGRIFYPDGGTEAGEFLDGQCVTPNPGLKVSYSARPLQKRPGRPGTPSLTNSPHTAASRPPKEARKDTRPPPHHLPAAPRTPPDQLLRKGDKAPKEVDLRSAPKEGPVPAAGYRETERPPAVEGPSSPGSPSVPEESPNPDRTSTGRKRNRKRLGKWSKSNYIRPESPAEN